MSKTMIFSILISGLSVIAAAPVMAASKHARSSGTEGTSSASHRGGYSYSYADSLNTYGNCRTTNDGADVYRDPDLAR